MCPISEQHVFCPQCHADRDPIPAEDLPKRVHCSRCGCDFTVTRHAVSA
jgi:predicted amidophosphoribosyltransferase